MSPFVWCDPLAIGASRTRRVLAGLFTSLALLASGAALAQEANTIQSMTVSKGTSGNTIVKFVLSAPPANPPAGFAIASPPRIALDFLDTLNGLGATQRTIDDPALRSLNVIQVANRTRVVFNLNRPQTFQTNVEGNAVLVTLYDQSGQLDASPQTVQRFAESQPGDIDHSLRDVDFRRGVNGEGRIVVDLSDNSTGIDIRQQGKSLIVDFVKTSLPRNLERRLDVQDFGTPVVSVDTFKQGPNTRMVIEPKGLWEHAAYQTNNKFILEVKPIQEDPNRLTQGTRQGYKGEKLSLNFQNVEVRAVLQVIADFTGLNIITSDTVNGSLTLRLKDIPWDQALDIIMQTKGLDMRKNGNVVLIAPREEIALKERQYLENAAAIADLEPLISESFQLNYIKAQDLLNLISTNRQQQFGLGAGQTATTGGQGSFISKRGVAMVDPRTNILFVQDTASRLEEIRKIIRQIDIPNRQVMIEARIVNASDNFSRQLGVRFGAQTGFTFNNKKYAGGQGGSLSTQPVVTCTGGTATTPATCTRETRTQTPFELASGTCVAGILGYAAAQRQSACHQPGRTDRADAHQSRQRQPHQSRIVGARGRQPREGHLQPARGDRGQSESQHRAGHRSSGGDARHCEQPRDGDVQEGRAEPAGHAADHAGQPHHDGGRDTQGLRWPVRAHWQRRLRAVDRHAQRDDPDHRQQRRHRGHRRHLRRDDEQHRQQRPVPRRNSGDRVSVQADEPHHREDRAPHLPDASGHQGLVVQRQVTMNAAAIAAAFRQSPAGNPPLRQGRRAGAALVGAIPILYNAAVQLLRNNLYLIGLPGAGKSTLGRQLARRLGLTFVDADTELERRLGVTIPTIFEIEGEAVFRDREEAMLVEIIERMGIVLGTGGGVVIRAANRDRLKANGTIIYLHADPVTLRERTRRSRDRPLLNATDPLARLQELYAQRDGLYREIADHVVESDREAIARFATGFVPETRDPAQA